MIEKIKASLHGEIINLQKESVALLDIGIEKGDMILITQAHDKNILIADRKQKLEIKIKSCSSKETKCHDFV